IQPTAGFWQYTQVIKVYDNEAPIIDVDTLDFCAFGLTGAAACNGEVMIPFTVADSCTEEVEVRTVMLDVDSKGNPVNALDDLYELTDLGGGNFTISSIAGQGLPVGAHVFMVTVADECGNVQVRRIPFTVKDCKTPAPICITNITLDLMPLVQNKEVVGGMNTLWATDVVASGITDCTPHPNADEGGDVKYYLFKGSVPDTLIEEEATTSVEFTCEDGNSVPAFLVAVDGAGNWDFCIVIVTLQPGADPNPCIENVGSAFIQGLVETEEARAVEEVEVSLSGNMNETSMTTIDGLYGFDNIIMGYDYSVTPTLDKEHMNGVSTFDIVLMTKHILGVEALDSPYKLIAADVNNSHTITTMDLIQARKLILSVDKEFSNNTSWRFVPTTYEFPDPANPWMEEIPELISLNDFSDDMMDGDFVAIKIGDVNGSAIPNSLTDDPRNASGTFELKLDEQQLVAGNAYEVPFTAENLSNIQGYQFTLNMEGLELTDLQYGIATAENFGTTHIADGVLTTSWNHPTGVEAEEDAVLFTLVLKAQEDVQLSEAISISSRYTYAEAYDLNGSEMNVSLNFTGTEAASLFEVYQNTPNPFAAETNISFALPQASEVTISFNDVTGKLLNVVQGNFNAGYNTITVNKSDLATSGVVYYTVATKNETVTKKMIIIE
ncbi:MAG: T9SS type A sorting domain-containing protein, partial [Bacteroidota bacterium]